MNWSMMTRVFAAAVLTAGLSAGSLAAQPAANAGGQPSAEGQKGEKVRRLGKFREQACERAKKGAEMAKARLEKIAQRIASCPENKKAEAQKLIEEARSHVAEAEKAVAENKCGAALRHLREGRQAFRKARTICGGREGRGGRRSERAARRSGGATGLTTAPAAQSDDEDND